MTKEYELSFGEKVGGGMLVILCLFAPLVNIALLGNSGWRYWLWLLAGIAILLALTAVVDRYRSAEER